MVHGFTKTFLLVAAVLSLTVIPTRAAAVDPWKKIDSPNFELVGNAPESQIKLIAQRLERFRTAVHKLFSIGDSASYAKIRVVVFKDAESFRPFKPKLMDSSPDDAASGYFQAGDDVSYIAVTADGDLSDIFHEYSHALFANKYGRGEIPPWLNEGLAEYLKTFREADDKSVEFGSIHARHIRTLQQNPLMAWDRLLGLDNFTLQQSGRSARAIFYAQSWALVHFLLGKKSSASMNEAVESIATTQREPVIKIGGEDIAPIDAGVKDLISQKTPILAVRRLGGESIPLSFATVELSGARTNAYLGDLLYHLRDDAAEIYVLRSLASEPNLGMANATLGLIRLRQRNFAEAKTLLEKALAADENSFLANYYYGFLLARESMDEFGNIERLPVDAARKMRSHISRSIAVNPTFAESYRLLALVGLITGENLEASLVAALRAGALQPANEEIALLTARIYARLNKMSEARSIAEKIYRNTASSYLRKEATAIIDASAKLSEFSTEAKRIEVSAIAGERPKPVILKWRDLTPAQISEISEEREINNLNILLDQPIDGERLALGSLEQVACGDERINYRFRTADSVLRLTTRDFSDLKVKVLTQGTRSFVFRCGATFASEFAVVRYRPASTRRDTGALVSITFVPKLFRLKPLEQIAREPLVVIEGSPPSNLEENFRASETERTEMERVFRESQIVEINEQLRLPGVNESRMIAVPEAVECRDEMMLISARRGDVLHTFGAPIAKAIFVRSFTPDAGLIEVGCRSKLPPVTAVITYRELRSPDSKLELVAIEFVPKIFRLK